MKAVWTILGAWTAAAAATGAGMMMLSAWSLDWGCCCGLSPRPLTLTSLSGLLVAEAGADELVGVVMSIGSPGDGADIWIVGVMMGTVLAPIGSSGPSAKWFLGALSVAAAICPMGEEQLSARGDPGGHKEKKSPRDPPEMEQPAHARIPSGPGRNRRPAYLIAARKHSIVCGLGVEGSGHRIRLGLSSSSSARSCRRDYVYRGPPSRAAFLSTAKCRACLDTRELGSRSPDTSYDANGGRFEGADTAVHAAVWAAGGLVVAVDWSRGEARGADLRNKWSGRCSFLSLAWWWCKDSGLKRPGLPWRYRAPDAG